MRQIHRLIHWLQRRAVFCYWRLGVIVGALPNTIANGQTIDAVPVMADFNWLRNQVNANAAELSLTPQLATPNTFAAANTFSVAGVYGGADTIIRRASTYVYTAWDPSDVANTLTNAAATASATSTATDYITVANASGTTTWTCVKAGVFRFTITAQNEFAAAATLLRCVVDLGGTATILLGTPTIIVPVANVGGFSPNQASGTSVFYAVMTAGQTVTILPKVGVASAGVTTNFTQQCIVSAEYTGT